MRILFSLRHPGALRNFASTIGELAERGHEIRLSFLMRDKRGDDRLLDELTAQYRCVTAALPDRRVSASRSWLGVARQIRYATDYLRYESPLYASAVALKTRAAQRAPGRFRRMMQLPGVRSRGGVRLAAGCLALAERALPPDARILAEVVAFAPDVVLVTPLVELGSDQVEYVKAARALGIRSGLCVHSWDNLSNKGLIRVLPDRVFVWNDAQKREAVTMHGVPADAVVVTGAPVYDQWFNRKPSRTRAEFCAAVGLRPDRPFFVYLCSSDFIAPDETVFVAQWIAALRHASDPSVRTAGILVRPHPRATLASWQAADLAGHPDVALWPRGGANPVDATSKNDYFDSLYHAAAAVGINTSAQIEAAIVGRPVYSVRAPQFAATQEGTLHFHLLLDASHGLVHMADTLEQHVRQLAEALNDPAAEAERLRTFVRWFVRPEGLDQNATSRLADGIERLARLPRRPLERAPVWTYPVRAALAPLARTRRSSAVPRGADQRLSTAQKILGVPAALFSWPPLTRYARRHIVPRVMPRAARQTAVRREATAVAKLIQRLATDDRPIIVGPWLDGVGFELLYWIPFLAWAMRYRPVAPERLIIVSRGGVARWYQAAGARYVELFELFPPEQLHARNAARCREDKGKHVIVTGFEREVIDRVREHTGALTADVLHPMHMYRLFAPYWKGTMPLDHLERFAVHQRLPDVPVQSPAGAVPGDYTAVRFHFNESFPETAENRAFVARTVRMLAEAGEVVLLRPGSGTTSEVDTPIEPHPRVRVAAPAGSLGENLEAQRQVIAGARMFVGTHGGFSHLASLQGVPSLSVYSHRAKLSSRHVELSQKVAGTVGASAYVIDTHDVSLFGLGFLERIAAPGRARPDAAAVRA